MNKEVKELKVYKILDSNGYWAIEAKLFFGQAGQVKASLPLAIDNQVDSVGNLRQASKVLKQLTDIIRPALLELEVEEDFALTVDHLLVDLKKKHKGLLAYTSLLISILGAKAGAVVSLKPVYEYLNDTYDLGQSNFTLPTPIFNLFNGGSHADTNLDFEEILLMPLSKNRTGSTEKIVNAHKVFQALGQVLRQAGLDTDGGSDGGYAPDVDSTIKVLDMIELAIEQAGFVSGRDMGIGIDVGSDRLYSPEQGKYIFRLDDTQFMTDTLINLYREWLAKYPIVYLEDGLSPADKDGWQSLTKQLGNQMILAGDTLFANQITKLRQGLKDHLANTVVIRLNTHTTLQSLVEFVKLAKGHNYGLVMAHNYSETNDDFLADLSVACGANYLKSGSLSRGERVAKYNRLLDIAQTLNI